MTSTRRSGRAAVGMQGVPIVTAAQARPGPAQNDRLRADSRQHGQTQPATQNGGSVGLPAPVIAYFL
jgi:hypothetical protein